MQSDEMKVIAAIRNQVRSICHAELNRLARRAPRWSEREHEELKLMLRRIEDGIVQPAVLEMKSIEGRGDAGTRRTLLESLFGMHREVSPSRTSG